MLNILCDTVRGIAYRTTKRYNVIALRDLEPGYYDKDVLLLHAVMQLLVDFVEIECAFLEEPHTARQRLYRRLPWFVRSDELVRDRELGLRHLDMMCQLYDDKLVGATPAPKELKAVYLWWKDVRPNRVDPNDATGITEYIKTRPTRDHKSNKKFDAMIRRAQKLEQQYAQEDTKMLMAVIKYREFMWT